MVWCQVWLGSGSGGQANLRFTEPFLRNQNGECLFFHCYSVDMLKIENPDI